MTNTLRILIIVIIIVVMLAVFLVFIMPALRTNMGTQNSIQEQRQTNRQLAERINQLSGLKDRFNILYAQYQKYSVELPSKTDIQVLTNEIYNIAQFADVDIQSVNYNEVDAGDQEEIMAIDINITVKGTYYDLLVFLKALESMPRSISLDSTELGLAAEGYPDMIGLVYGRTYYQINP
ncbi:MAG: type 4a pilus biogenesis protein PilO [Actinomycetia bacterium]|nr:type 4a pilus biogenesis protein PilO [Actinomycetes bacterium]